MGLGMLRIHTVTSAAGAKSYYQASDYYSQGQETIGQWGGRLRDSQSPLRPLERLGASARSRSGHAARPRARRRPRCLPDLLLQQELYVARAPGALAHEGQFSCDRVRHVSHSATSAPQHCFHFLIDPQRQRSFRPGFFGFIRAISRGDGYTCGRFVRPIASAAATPPHVSRSRLPCRNTGSSDAASAHLARSLEMLLERSWLW